MGDREGAIVMSGEGGVDSKAKVNICLSYPILGLKSSSLICLPSCSNWHMLDWP